MLQSLSGRLGGSSLPPATGRGGQLPRARAACRAPLLASAAAGSRGEGTRGWVLDPVVQLQQLAGSPDAADLPVKQPRDPLALLLRMPLGQVPEEVAGPYGSGQRVHFEQGLILELLSSPTHGYLLQEQHHSVLHSALPYKLGTHQAAADLHIYRNNPSALATADRWTREGVVLSGQRLSVHYAPSKGGPAGTSRLTINHLPGQYAVVGLTQALLTCAGYINESVQVVSEHMGAFSLGGQQVVGVGNMGNIIAWVVPPADDPMLRSLPSVFMVAGQTVRVFLEGRDDRVPTRVFPPGPEGWGFAGPLPSPPPPPPRSPPTGWHGPGSMDIDSPPPAATTLPGAGSAAALLGAAASLQQQQAQVPPAPAPASRAHPMGLAVAAPAAAGRGRAPGDATGLGAAGPARMDVDQPPAPQQSTPQQFQQQGAPAGMGHVGSMHPARQARLAAEAGQRGLQQQQPQQQQPQPPAASKQTRRRRSKGRRHTYAQWAEGATAKEILGVLGFALDELPKVEEEGGKEAAFQAFFAWCTEGEQEQTLLRQWEQQWQQRVPGAAAGLPRWVKAWIKARYDEEPGYGSDSETGSTASARSRGRSRSRSCHRRPGQRCPPPAAAAAAAAAVSTIPVRAPASAEQQQSAQPSGPQLEGTMLRSGRLSRPPDPGRLFGGQGHA